MHGDPFLTTADLVDLRSDAQISKVPFRSYGGRKSVAGVAETIRVGPSLGRLREMLSEPGHQRVLVVDAGGADSQWAIFGDRMAGRGVDNGWQGVVIDGLIRDAGTLAELDFGVWALGTWPEAAGLGSEDGERSVSLVVGGAQVEPGWWVACDLDGFVSCPTGPEAEAAGGPGH